MRVAAKNQIAADFAFASLGGNSAVDTIDLSDGATREVISNEAFGR